MRRKYNKPQAGITGDMRYSKYSKIAPIVSGVTELRLPTLGNANVNIIRLNSPTAFLPRLNFSHLSRVARLINKTSTAVASWIIIIPTPNPSVQSSVGCTFSGFCIPYANSCHQATTPTKISNPNKLISQRMRNRSGLERDISQQRMTVFEHKCP